MSHRIVYRHLAVKWTAKELDNPKIYWDCFLLFELGGDNNLTTIHPATHRELPARHWLCVGAGYGREVMRSVVKLSAFCEGGDMRMLWSPDTRAESYIRHVRGIVAKAVTPGKARDLGFSVKYDGKPILDSTALAVRLFQGRVPEQPWREIEVDGPEFPPRWRF